MTSTRNPNGPKELNADDAKKVAGGLLTSTTTPTKPVYEPTSTTTAPTKPIATTTYQSTTTDGKLP